MEIVVWSVLVVGSIIGTKGAIGSGVIVTGISKEKMSVDVVWIKDSRYFLSVEH